MCMEAKIEALISGSLILETKESKFYINWHDLPVRISPENGGNLYVETEVIQKKTMVLKMMCGNIFSEREKGSR